MNSLKIVAFLFCVEPDATFLWVDMAKLHDTALAPWVFNLYVDPKEQYAVGHRMNA